jgi:hypothetical protein
MTTRDKVLEIRAEEPNAQAADIARTVGVTRERVRQILQQAGLPTEVGGTRGRPRQKAALWSSRKRKANLIRKRLESGQPYREADGTIWFFVTDLTAHRRLWGLATITWGQVIVSTWAGAVKTGERIYPNIDAALEAEV